METAKQVNLVSNNLQISEMKIHEVGKDLVRTSKVE